jgi:hypothetical protein
MVGPDQARLVERVEVRTARDTFQDPMSLQTRLACVADKGHPAIGGVEESLDCL